MLRKAVLFLAATVGLTLAAAAQNVTHESYTQARQTLDRAIAAYGGLQELRAIENVSIKVEGDTVHRNQSKKAFAFDRTPLQGGIHHRPEEHPLPPAVWMAIIRAGSIGSTGSRSTRPKASHGTNCAAHSIRYPTCPRRIFAAGSGQFLILWCLMHTTAYRVFAISGTANFDGRQHSVISYSNEDGLEISLYIDDKTGLLSKNEYLFTDPFTGDTVSEMVYTGYRQENGRMVPTGRRDLLSGELVSDVKISEMRFNTTLTDENFKLPTGIESRDTRSRGTAVHKIQRECLHRQRRRI